MTVLMLLTASSSYAQDEENAEDVNALIEKQDDSSYKKDFETGEAFNEDKDYIYEEPTYDNFLLTQIALKVHDYANDPVMNEYLRIKECQIYSQNRENEFEWKKIKDQARVYIEQNIIDFPMRYELIIPIHLSEYSEKRSAFLIDEKDQVRSARLFELKASNDSIRNMITCRALANDHIGDTYVSFILELSRPFSLIYVPSTKEMAEAYSKEKNQEFLELKNKVNNLKAQSLRTAYAILNVRIFTFKAMDNTSKDPVPIVFASLEGYDIYADIDRTKLFYSKNYVSKRDKKKIRENFEEEIAIIKERFSKNGILAKIDVDPDDVNEKQENLTNIEEENVTGIEDAASIESNTENIIDEDIQ